MKIKILLCAAITGGILLNACKKDISTQSPLVSKIEKRNLSNDDKILKLRLEQSSKVIAEVLKDKSIASELTEQIARKLKITNNDEALTFRELFQKPDGRQTQSSDSQNQKVFSLDVSVANHFREKYFDVLKNKTYDNPEKYKDLEKVSNISTDDFNDDPSCYDCITDLPPGAQLYLPYSENFLSNNYGVDPNLAYTVTSHPIDNSDENEGVTWNPYSQTWDYVVVDDNYAWSNPTYIITIDDRPTTADYSSNSLEGIPTLFLPEYGINNEPPPPPFINPNPIEGSRVYYGKMHIEKFAEGLFDGGSEIVLVRPIQTPVLTANGDLSTANVAVDEYISLPKIRRGKIRDMINDPSSFIYVGGTFTNEWKPVNVNLPLVIYEYDKGGSLDITLPTVKFKIKVFGQDVEVTTPGSFKYNVPSRSTPYLVESVTRASYGVFRNISNPGTNPGQYDNWRSWGFQATNVTLITEGTWIGNN